MKDGLWQVFIRTIKFSRRKWSGERGCRLDGELELEDGWGTDEGLQTGGLFVGPGWTWARLEASSRPMLTPTSTPKTTWGAVGWRPAASQKSKQPKVNNSWATSKRDGLYGLKLSIEVSWKRVIWARHQKKKKMGILELKYHSVHQAIITLWLMIWEKNEHARW